MIQVDYRRVSVATKLKVIYVKDTVLDVRQLVPSSCDATLPSIRHSGEDPVESLYVFREFSTCGLVLMYPGQEWTDCFTLKDISLPLNPYLGFSAMTGDVSDAHEYAYLQSDSFVLRGV